MGKEDIRFMDLHRILFGGAPPVFLIEVFFRTLIIYVILLVGVKLLGKRMKGQLSVPEMVVMITLGAIVSVPMQIPERGLLQGILILVIIILLQRTIARVGVTHKNIERLTQGNISILVKDGVIQLDAMAQAKITRQELFSILREEEIYSLGKVYRVYLEACGLFSVHKSKDEQKPGLPILPGKDVEIIKAQRHANGTLACTNCGLTVNGFSKGSCNNCQKTDWTTAIV